MNHLYEKLYIIFLHKINLCNNNSIKNCTEINKYKYLVKY